MFYRYCMYVRSLNTVRYCPYVYGRGSFVRRPDALYKYMYIEICNYCCILNRMPNRWEEWRRLGYISWFHIWFGKSISKDGAGPEYLGSPSSSFLTLSYPINPTSSIPSIPSLSFLLLPLSSFFLGLLGRHVHLLSRPLLASASCLVLPHLSSSFTSFHLFLLLLLFSFILLILLCPVLVLCSCLPSSRLVLPPPSPLIFYTTLSGLQSSAWRWGSLKFRLKLPYCRVPLLWCRLSGNFGQLLDSSQLTVCTSSQLQDSF